MERRLIKEKLESELAEAQFNFHELIFDKPSDAQTPEAFEEVLRTAVTSAFSAGLTLGLATSGDSV